MRSQSRVLPLSQHEGGHHEGIDQATEDFLTLVGRFGFFPHHSAIFTWYRLGKEVLVQRADLYTTEKFREWFEQVLAPVAAYQPDQVQVSVVFSETASGKAALIQLMEAGFREVDIRVIESTTVCAAGAVGDTSSYWLWTSQCLTLCGEGHLLNENATRDLDLLTTRDKLTERFDYQPAMAIDPEIIKNVFNRGTSDKDRWRTNQLRLIARFIRSEGHPSDLMAARIAFAFSDVRVRDTVLWDLAAGEIEPQFLTRRLVGLIPRLNGEWVTGLICVTAVAAWLEGNGVTANMCVDRALAEAPNNNLAKLLGVSLSNGISPQLWVESVLELSREECRYGVHRAPNT